MMLDTALTWGALSVSAGAAAYSLFYAWPRGKRGQPGTLTSEEDNFTWAVMGGVSCIPLFNSMAWVLGALQSDTPRPFAWAAALYALPLLRNGLDQDWFSLSLLLLGVAHMQALRIGATEPELQARLQQQLRPLSVVSSLAGAAGAATRAALGTGAGGSQQQQQQQQQQLEQGGWQTVASLGARRQRGGDDGDDGVSEGQEEELVRRRDELADFDRRLQQLAATRKEEEEKEELL